MHARNCGLKSTYYLRNKSASEIEKSTGTVKEESNVDNTNADNNNDSLSGVKACSILDPDCESCQ